MKTDGLNKMTDFMKFPTAREQVLTYGDTTIGIIPDICLVSHFQVGTWPVLYRPSETGNVKRWGMPLMIPIRTNLRTIQGHPPAVGRYWDACDACSSDSRLACVAGYAQKPVTN